MARVVAFGRFGRIMSKFESYVKEETVCQDRLEQPAFPFSDHFLQDSAVAVIITILISPTLLLSPTSAILFLASRPGSPPPRCDDPVCVWHSSER